MPRSATPANTLPARIRRYFGMQQDELARYLGVSVAQASRLEAGRRGLTVPALAVLGPLADHVPPTAPAPASDPADFGVPDRAPLEARLDYCRHRAAQVRRLLRPLEQQATVAGRWRAALPAILATLPPDPGGAEPPAVLPGQGRWLAYLGWYRWRWLLGRPTALPPDLSARYHLLRLQAEALETEAAALVALLA